MRRIAFILLLSLLSASALSAQQRVLLSRSALDSLVYPTLSAEARGKVVATPAKCDLGIIDQAKSAIARFTLKNTTTKAITLRELRTTCSCAEVLTKIDRLEAGESRDIEVGYNPAGRSGEFSTDIFVYTDLDSVRPTKRLTIVGQISTSDRFLHLSKQMGTLRLSRTAVTLDGLTIGSTRSERIVVANAGDRAITLSARPTIEGIEFSLHPATLQPGEEGEIVISYTPRTLPARNIETMIVVEGCEARPTERMIRITIKR
ncbi:MAG: DUF1573 domain-containing protein [Alistipes sp.]|nr:DUF1573 domain-containing protein [Alistipes sp.]